MFYGPVYDNNGELRINEGENISDKTMMYDLMVCGRSGNGWAITEAEIY